MKKILKASTKVLKSLYKEIPNYSIEAIDINNYNYVRRSKKTI